MSVYQMTQLVIQKLERYQNRIEFIWSIHIIDNEKIGQTPAEFDNVIEMFLNVGCGINAPKGNKFLLVTYDPAQIQPT